MGEPKSSNLHIAMYPWLAMGHITPYLHLSNKLAQRGHKISFFLSKKPQLQLQNINLHPNLITFHTITVPQLNDLPLGTETASDIPFYLNGVLATAFDLTRDQVETLLCSLKPDIVFYDLAHWLPELTTRIGLKSVCYNIISACSLANLIASKVLFSKDTPPTEEELTGTPPGYPFSTVVLRPGETKAASTLGSEFGKGITFLGRIEASNRNCDAISMRTCQELEGQFCDYISNHFNKPVLLTGPSLPESTTGKTSLEDRWTKWLDGFEPGTVIYCAMGTQWVVEKDQFQELVLGLELTGLPFLAALRPPTGATTVEEALPEGFEERVGDRGVVYGGWVQQTHILDHPSVGCYVCHCGFGSMWECLLSDNQAVTLPHLGDQILNARLLSEELKVAVEIEKEENRWFSKERFSKTIKTIMDGDSEVGCLVRKNHARWKETLTKPGFMSGYVDEFVKKLHRWTL